MNKEKLIQAISDCTDPRDASAGVGDICRAMGQEPSESAVTDMTRTLRKDMRGYVSVITNGGAVRVHQRTHAGNARAERREAQQRQWLLATITAILATLLGVGLGALIS